MLCYLNARIINGTILVSIVITQVALWISYYLFFNQKDINITALWGDTPGQLQTPLLVIAGIAYVMNLWLLVNMAMSHNLTESEEWTIVGCIIAYYVAQLLFLPLTNLAVNKKIPKCVVTLLLVLCVIPFVILTGVVTKHSMDPESKGTLVKLITAFIPLLHVLIDDAVLFGFLF